MSSSAPGAWYRRLGVVVGLAGGLAIRLVAGLAAVAAHAAGPPLPQRNLSVEVRVVEQSIAERQALGGAGSVVVGTGGNATLSGGVTLRAGSDSRHDDSVQRVLVLNGGRATLRLSQLTPLRSAEWLWVGRGQGVAEQTTWVDVGRGLEVRPAWPGGTAPVRVEVSIESSGRGNGGTPPGLAARTGVAGDVDATTPRLVLQTELSLPLGEWVTVAQLASDSSGSGGGVSGNTSGVGGNTSGVGGNTSGVGSNTSGVGANTRGVSGHTSGVSSNTLGVGASTRTLRSDLSLQLRVTVP